MSEHEDVARRLAARAQGLVPEFTVDTSGVIRAGRRRRMATRVGAMVAVAAVVSGGGLAANAAFGSSGGRGALAAASSPESSVASSPSVSTGPAVSPSPSATPTATPTAPVLPPPVSPYGVAGYTVSDGDGEMSGASGDPWPGDELYWHVLAEVRAADGTVTETRESWSSRERPGVVVSDGDLDGAAVSGPKAVLGGFVVDGVHVEMLAEPAYLPTDPAALAAVLRASVQADIADDRGVGTEDDRVIERVVGLLTEQGGLLTQDLRLALWQAAGTVPGAVVTAATDPGGRSAARLEYTPSSGGTERLFVDPATVLELARSDADSGETVVVLEQGPASTIPRQPTLAWSGCAHWQSC